MRSIIFAMPGNETLAEQLAEEIKADLGKVTIRRFPDGESYVRIHNDVQDCKVVIVCTLHLPDDKFLPLYFLTCTLKDMGAKYVCLVAPYLSYMRQDKVFYKGEGVTSKYFASMLSLFTDGLITVDPHLHRIGSLHEIYSTRSKVVHASGYIAKWIKVNVRHPFLIGPDSESEQWVSEIAKEAQAPYLVLEKVRHGDDKVSLSFPQIDILKTHTPVLIDDIISTAQTMITTVDHLSNTDLKPPICIGIHAVFANNAYQDLLHAGAAQVVTCNTIPHVSNKIDLSDIYKDFIINFPDQL